MRKLCQLATGRVIGRREESAIPHGTDGDILGGPSRKIVWDRDRGLKEKMMSKSLLMRWIFGCLFLSILTVGSLLAAGDTGTDWTAGKYEGTREQVLELMGHYKAIQLTPEQEAIRREALSNMPAPCCNNFSAATCCCECNLSRSLWGLSKLLITEHKADAAQVRTAVEGWIEALNPSGYEGKTCSTGRCNLPFKQGGCGGMMEHRLNYGD